MDLEFKSDFALVRGRWEAFWRGESRRPLLHAIRPKPDVTAVSRPRPYDCAFGDLDPIIEQTLGWAATHEFLGDAIPSFMITFSPDHFAALLGADIKAGEGTGTNWVKPCMATLDDAEIRFQPDGYWWRRTVECVERFRAKCDGKLIVTGTHLQGGLDCLVALYGAEPLFMDMAMDPEKVHAALDQVDDALLEVRTAMRELFDVSHWGSLNRFGMYSPGLIDVPQCDASCMISRGMFEEFQRPHLVKEIESTDASVYHLDGPDALPHTESLCSIEPLDMIQWMPGAGHYDDDWRELNRKIDALGKGQIFQTYYKLTDADIKRIWNEFSSRKLFFQVEPDQCERLMREFGDVDPAI
jgi:hypothetical protein